jgi:hypothetical protein
MGHEPLVVGVTLELSKENVERLINRAILWGFIKSNERKRWTHKDRKEAIRYIIKQWAQEGK